MKKEFVIFGSYIITGEVNDGKIELDMVNVNPQHCFGKSVDARPLIECKDNKVAVNWTVKELK